MNVHAVRTQGADQRDDLQRLDERREDLGFAEGARHPEVRAGQAPDAGQDAAGAKPVLLREPHQRILQVGPGRQATGVHVHG